MKRHSHNCQQEETLDETSVIFSSSLSIPDSEKDDLENVFSPRLDLSLTVINKKHRYTIEGQANSDYEAVQGNFRMVHLVGTKV